METMAPQRGYAKLRKFHSREGHCMVNHLHREDDFELGKWVITQRATQEKLSADRRGGLDRLDFVWKPQHEAWEQGFKKLQQFHSREGHCRVPQKQEEDDFNLGRWVMKQRMNKHRLSIECKEKLNAVNFLWKEI